MQKIFLILLLIMISTTLFGCNSKKTDENLWENATYTENTELGEGEKTILLDVVTPEKSITFTVNTDKENLEDALVEHNLIAGEKGAYGLYIKIVNGITADYNVNQCYWSLSKNSEYMQTGAGATKILDGDKYELTYTK